MKGDSLFLKKIFDGVVWNGSQLLIGKGFDFLIKLVLARLLLPEDFGIVAVATIFIGFIQVLNELGIGAALIQKKEEAITSDHYSTSFSTGIVWSLVLYIVFSFVLAPVLAHYYRIDRLTEIIPIIALSLISGAITLVHKVKLTRDLNFKVISIINNISVIFSGVLSLILAYLDAGIWSLVFNSVATFVVAIPMYFAATKWKPSFSWKKDVFLDIFSFGAYTTLTNFINRLLANIDYLVLGRLVGASMLGSYSLAFMLTETVRSNLMAMVNSVMFPIYGKLQDSKKQSIYYYLNVIKFNCLVVFPILLVFGVFSEEIILLIFGEKWSDSIVPLKILALASFVHMLINGHTSLIRGMGFAKLELHLQLVKAFLFYIPIIWFATFKFGIIGTAYGVLISKVLEVILVKFILNKYLHIKVKTVFNSVKGVLFSAVISWLVISSLQNFIESFVLNVLILLIVYLFIVFWFIGDEISVLKRTFLKKDNL